jgi:hypothetical protein
MRRSAIAAVCYRGVVAGAVMVLGGCTNSTRVASVTADSAALSRFKTFTVSAPTPRISRVAVAATNDSDRVGGATMDMDPMLATSLVGRAMSEDRVWAFTHRGYQTAQADPDFQVAYYAGTGRVLDTRAYATSYHATGHKIDTRTFEYPAGTIIVDVVNARSDSLVWRGTGLAEIPDNPEDYARTVRGTIDQVVAQFPKAER